MTIEFSFMTGIFTSYEICTGEPYGKVVDHLGTDWYIYVYGKHRIPTLACPCTILKCRYQGIEFDTIGDKDQLAMLKRKLEEDFAIERLE